MKSALSKRTGLAAIGALLAVLVATYLPWPQILAGDEQLAPARMPQTRSALAVARQQSESTASTYKQYVSTHDLTALLQSTTSAISTAKADPSSSSAIGEVKQNTQQVLAYAQVLHNYSQASDTYLAALQKYDDDLMSWTRGLGAKSETLRDKTWPFVEYLKNYPAPIGLKTDPQIVNAGEVAAQIASLKSHVGELDRTTGAQATSALDAVSGDVAGIWSSGRSVEYIGGLHSQYDSDLATYDRQVQTASGETQYVGERRDSLMATGLSLVVGLTIFGGILALLLPRSEAA